MANFFNQSKFRKRSIGLLLFIVCGCAKSHLSVFTEYVSIESLPSFQIGTPDPALFCPDIGEKIHIRWSIPNTCKASSLQLHLKIRFGNNEEDEVWLNLLTPTGIYVYPLMNNEYWKKEGVFTFKVELYGDGSLLDVWQHQLWAERITLGETE